MDLSQFVSPLQAVQVLSIFNYLSTLSDVLYAENFLDKQDQHKPIPVINALYRYLQQDEKAGDFGIQHRKLHLTRKLLNGTDLYGAKEHEILDPYFTDSLFNHIINNLVFRRFTNVFGFIADITRILDSDSLITLQHHLKKALISLTFENDSGDDSKLEPLAVDTIFVEIIEPLLPRPQNFPVQITSIDYLYAMAGNMFLKFDQTGKIRDEFFNQENVKLNVQKQYQEHIEIAHTIEQLILANKLDQSALKVFAFPALINYVHKEKKNLESVSIEAILSSPDHWKKAYKNLFAYVNDAFLQMDNVQEKDYRYQFHLALSNYKNRTQLAREVIEINCLSISEQEMEQEILKYKNNPTSYKCELSGQPLQDLNTLYHDMVNNITKKYFIYEKESCRAAFGDNFIKEMDSTNVVITKGLIHYFYYGDVGFLPDSQQIVNASHDLLQFYFPDSEKYLYYALVRNGYNISLIKEADNPKSFRTTLGLDDDEILRYNFFPIDMKTKEEKFNHLLEKIAEERSETFRKNLESIGYDETRKEWWINFGLSLIPFYTCVKDIEEKNDEAELMCPLDGLLLFPIVSQMGQIAAKTAEVAMKSVTSVTETTLRTVILRSSIRTILRVTGKTLIEEFVRFEELFTKETFKHLGIAIFRFIDPGFELAFTLGHGGLRFIKSLVVQAERKFSTASQSVKFRLSKAQYTMNNFAKKLNQNFRKDAYVTSIYDPVCGYGYKYIPLKNKIAEIRKIFPSKKEIPLVARTSSEERKIYDQVDLENEKIIGDDYFLEDEGVVSEEQYFEFNFIHNEKDVLVEGGKLVSTFMQTFKSRKALQEAVEFALQKGKLREPEIRNELKKYAFPEADRTEMSFVRDWMNNPELKTPTWAEIYKVEEPDLFFQLKYKETMDTPHLELKDAREKIESLYPVQQHSDIIKELPVDRLLKDFKKMQGYKSVRFEDYYALRWYGGSGYRKMAESSHEARRMKIAIYKLAVRQSEDPSEQYVAKLFRGEGRVPEAIEKEISDMNKEFEFNRFTSTSTDINTAIKYSLKGHPSSTRVIYVMTFRKPIVRARVEDLFVLEEKETILLPGTKFHIDKIQRYVEVLDSGVKQNCIRVEMTHIDLAKELREKSIMQEIKKLRDTDTAFYPEDLL